MTVLAVDCSLELQLRGSLDWHKHVALELVRILGPALLAVVVFSEQARAIEAAQLPALDVDFVYGTNTAAAITLGRETLAGVGEGQIVLVTSCEPSAETLDNGDIFFTYPPIESTLRKTIAEAERCAKEGIIIRIVTAAEEPRTVEFLIELSRVSGGDALTRSELAADANSLDRFARPQG